MYHPEEYSCKTVLMILSSITDLNLPFFLYEGFRSMWFFGFTLLKYSQYRFAVSASLSIQKYLASGMASYYAAVAGFSATDIKLFNHVQAVVLTIV